MHENLSCKARLWECPQSLCWLTKYPSACFGGLGDLLEPAHGSVCKMLHHEKLCANPLGGALSRGIPSRPMSTSKRMACTLSRHLPNTCSHANCRFSELLSAFVHLHTLWPRPCIRAEQGIRQTYTIGKDNAYLLNKLLTIFGQV